MPVRRQPYNTLTTMSQLGKSTLTTMTQWCENTLKRGKEVLRQAGPSPGRFLATLGMTLPDFDIGAPENFDGNLHFKLRIV